MFTESIIVMTKKISNKIVAVVGTTASGKTKLGVELVRKFNGEIVSADSRQVYKGMDIGTGKDLSDYFFRNWRGQRTKIAYHLLDVVEPDQDFDLAEFQKEAYKVIDDILSRGKLPIIVGGSGLYAQALVEGYELSSAGRDEELRRKVEELPPKELFKKIEHKDPDFASRINQSDRGNKLRLTRYWERLNQETVRSGSSFSPRYQALVLGLTYPPQQLEQRIRLRLKQRLEQEGMIEEVKSLSRDKGLSWSRLESFGLEYKWVAYYLQGKLDYEEMFSGLFQDIKKFAKKQLSWLRRWQKQGRQINWVKDKKEAGNRVKAFLKE